MKRYLSFILISSAVVALSGCNSTVFDRYFEQSVALFSSRGNTMSGQLNFTEISYYTAYQQVCDYRTVCEGYPVQTMIQTLGLSDPGRDHHPAPAPVPGHGGGHDGDHHGDDHHGGGGHTPPPVYFPPPGYYHPGPRCWTQAYNCREVPYQASSAVTIPTQVTATITGADTNAIGVMTFEVHANPEFPAFAVNPESPFKDVTPGDQNLLVLKSKTYELVPGQNFLELPANFKAGDPLNITVQVQPASNPKLGVSAVGTTVALPPLEFSQDQSTR